MNKSLRKQLGHGVHELGESFHEESIQKDVIMASLGFQ